jgi:hypothetical protein
VLSKCLSINQCWSIPALALLLTLANNAKSQTVVYGQFPVTGGTTFPEDAKGLRLWGEDGYPPQTYNFVINGQVAYTFYAGTEFDIQPSSNSAVIATQPNLANNPNDPTAFPMPLTAGQQIGPGAAGYSWLGNILGGDTLTAARASGIIGQPNLTVGYFTGLEQGYIGLQFQQNGQTYYGWVSAGAPYIGINGGWIYNYAYSTIPNAPIIAGAGLLAPLAPARIVRPGNLRLTWPSQNTRCNSRGKWLRVAGLISISPSSPRQPISPPMFPLSAPLDFTE